ncbi:MAG: CRISPR-associated helicase Cas3' [Eubacteriales bacterium]|jgi:CRISPR-associated endonuclease/helicase Cas3
MFAAHIKKVGEEKQIHTVADHSLETAKYAAETLAPVGLAQTGRAAGLIHDCGKYTEAFQKYLSNAADENPDRKGSVIHTFACVRYLIEEHHSQDKVSSISDITSELIAYAAGAHHGQFDCFDKYGENGFEHRVIKDSETSKEAINNFFTEFISREEYSDLLKASEKEIELILSKCKNLGKKNDERMYYISLTVRLLLSAVINGDRRSTAEFLNDTVFPDFVDTTTLWERCLNHTEDKLENLNSDSQKKTKRAELINKARAEISSKCRKFAENMPGIYRLNVPTGGGKTLSSLRFALAHAKAYGKSRIIFTSPLLSILDQNAKVIREYIGDDNIVLEHHSNVVIDDNIDEQNRYDLLSESWDSPVIITTLVQLLNTLFEDRNSSVRRFRSLINSIIVIDEVQTVPVNLLTHFNLACNYLAEICGATIVLCSATQPCLESVEHSLIIKDGADIVPFDENLWKPFRRTKIINAGRMKLDEIPEFALQKLSDTQSLLIVCNKKSQAEQLWLLLKNNDFNCFHLSASMCMEHRKDTLDRIYYSLKIGKETGEKTVVISTQVIEAGVDISFGCVIRLCAGMDSVIQAAGRCNRNGEKEGEAPVYIVLCSDENLNRLQDIKDAQDASVDLLTEFKYNTGRYSDNLSSDKAINYYYRRLYEKKRGFMDIKVNGYPSMFNLLSLNDCYYKFAEDKDKKVSKKYKLRSASKTAGKIFTVFDSVTYDCIVPYKED